MADQRERVAEFQESIRAAILGFLAETWTALPGIVQSFDPQEMTVKVQSAIQVKVRPSKGNPQWTVMPPLIHCPVVFPSAGGFILTLPIQQGDEVLVVFASRCIDGWWQQGGTQAQPPELRMHDLSDGFAIPGPRGQKNLVSNISTTTAQLRTVDGQAYVELTADHKVNIVAPGGVNINGNVVVEGTVEATEEGTFNGGHTVSAHVHGGVQVDSGETQKPTG
jgi:hypothetical protein